MVTKRKTLLRLRCSQSKRPQSSQARRVGFWPHRWVQASWVGRPQVLGNSWLYLVRLVSLERHFRRSWRKIWKGHFRRFLWWRAFWWRNSLDILQSRRNQALQSKRPDEIFVFQRFCGSIARFCIPWADHNRHKLPDFGRLHLRNGSAPRSSKGHAC